MKGTMDEQVMRALKDKAADQNALMAAVKAKLRTVKEQNALPGRERHA